LLLKSNDAILTDYQEYHWKLPLSPSPGEWRQNRGWHNPAHPGEALREQMGDFSVIALADYGRKRPAQPSGDDISQSRPHF
jgi:hypothetical protein